MDKVNNGRIFTRICSVLVFIGVLWQLYIFEVMRRFHNLEEAGFGDTTGSFELLGTAKYAVLAFSILCALLGFAMWCWKSNRILMAVISVLAVFSITLAITVWIVSTAYTPVLEHGS